MTHPLLFQETEHYHVVTKYEVDHFCCRYVNNKDYNHEGIKASGYSYFTISNVFRFSYDGFC